jgi:hypothetical protein
MAESPRLVMNHVLDEKRGMAAKPFGFLPNVVELPD